MSVRRWIGMTGVVVAVAAGTAATGLVGPEPQFEAQASLLIEGPQPRSLHVEVLKERERFLDSPAVQDLVRSRLGVTPPVRATAADDIVLVRSRGATPSLATEATRTYAESYVDVTRRRVEGEVSAGADAIRRKTDEIKAQLESADGPQRSSLVEALGMFNTRLDELQGDRYGPTVVGLDPAEPVDGGTRLAWFVVVLGATVGAGAAVSARRTGRQTTRGQ